MENTYPSTDEPPKSPSTESVFGNSLLSFFVYLKQTLQPFIPCVFGLAFTRSGVILTNYAGYEQTDGGLLTDSSMMTSLILLMALFFFIMFKKQYLSKSFVNRLMRVCVLTQASCTILIAVFSLLNIDNFFLLFSVAVAISFCTSISIAYWLRRLRGSDSSLACLYVFTALIVSETLLYILTFLPKYTALITIGIFVLSQLLCIKQARKNRLAHICSASNPSEGYFGFAKNLVSNKRFLTVTAVGIGLFSFIIGFLRGAPTGNAIPFTDITRFGDYIITVLISILIIYFTLIKKRHSTMTIGIWIVMQVLVCLAMFCYVAFPNYLEIGAIFTTTSNAMMMVFSWYIILAFTSYGWRDPYYYAIAGWLVWMGCRALGRLALIAMQPLIMIDGTLHGTDLMFLMLAITLVICTQVVFTQFFGIMQSDLSTEKKARSATRLEKIMGLDGASSFSDVREATMASNAQEIGRQFMLSDREIEVLALYALGHTQKNVAERLFISQGTAHAHIKRIYSKTGFHSRQDVLDYIVEHLS